MDSVVEAIPKEDAAAAARACRLLAKDAHEAVFHFGPTGGAHTEGYREGMMWAVSLLLTRAERLEAKAQEK